MWKNALALASLAVFGLVLSARAQDKPQSIEEQATHVDTGNIEVPQVNAFCLDADGRILAACGAGPGTVRVLDVNGAELRSWEVDIKPEAINTTPGGDILVGGVGQLLRFSADGKLLSSAESPHARAMRDSADQMREAAIAQLTRGRVDYRATVESYKQMISQLQAKKQQGQITEQEERVLAALPTALASLEKRVADQEKKSKKPSEPSESDIQKLVDSMIRSKMRIASISTDGQHIYVATSAAVGYGYDVWKLANDFSGGEQIVTGLRGCCGQMDVQCCASGVYVAENSRHRVVCFDRDGKERISWGKRDRTGIDGFTSCCNPMNVCFTAEGDVLTAESTTGRIKRFNKDGEFLAYVGDVKLVPGCKNVSIAISPDGEHVYMLDITRGRIVVMTKKAGAAAASEPDA